MRATLVARARDGDEAAFESLVDLDGGRCFSIAYRILRDVGMAEDAVQAALLRAWAQLPQLRDIERYEVWLKKLLVNACYDELRRYRRWKDRITVLPIDGLASRDPFGSADDRDALDRAFARLEPDRRAAFVLHHHAGVPLAEIAEILGLPLGTVKSRLHYSIEILRAALEADARGQETEARGA